MPAAARFFLKNSFLWKIGKIQSDRCLWTLVQFKKKKIASRTIMAPSMIDPVRVLEPPCRLVPEKYTVVLIEEY
jgi:hypothetical protein